MDVLESKEFFYGKTHPASNDRVSINPDGEYANFFLSFRSKEKRAEIKAAKAQKKLEKGNVKAAQRKLGKAEKLSPGITAASCSVSTDPTPVLCNSVMASVTCRPGAMPTGKKSNPLPTSCSATTQPPVQQVGNTPDVKYPPQSQYPYPPGGGNMYGSMYPGMGCYGGACYGAAPDQGTTSNSNMLIYGAFGVGAIVIIMLLAHKKKA